MTTRRNGPTTIGDTADSLLSSIERMRQTHRQRIEAAALPGETFEQAEARIMKRDEPQTAPAARPQQLPASLVRKPPKGDEQADFFVPGMYDVDGRDGQSVMDVAVFRLSKRDKRAGDVIRYDLPDGFVEVKAGPDGMASVWDYDLVLMMVSHLTEAMNRYRDGKEAGPPGRVFRPHVTDILKFCRRGDGSRQVEEVESALDRLRGTTIKTVREKGKTRTTEAEGLISRYRVLSRTDTNKIASVEIEAPDWIYREVIAGKVPKVLTVHRDYFLIESGIGRFLYRLARRAAGKGGACWSFQTIYERSGSGGTFKKFCFTLRKIIEANDLPEYDLQERPGKDGPQLAMTLRASLDAPAPEGGS